MDFGLDVEQMQATVEAVIKREQQAERAKGDQGALPNDGPKPRDSREMKAFQQRVAWAIVSATTGRNYDTDRSYIGRRVYDRDGRDCGVVRKVRRCRLDGCLGTGLLVRWPDGQRTWICAKGCRVRNDGVYQIR
jgi:hypothetical protein